MTQPEQYTGKARYHSDLPHEEGALLVAVFCRFASVTEVEPALLDTGAKWCVLRSDLVEALGYTSEAADPARMSTRFGTIFGGLVRIPLTLPAAEGEDLTLEATCFVSPNWPGPTVLGWKGCLERIRFALEPHEELFYFANQ